MRRIVGIMGVIFGCAALALAAPVPAGRPNPNLIVNGGFEEGPKNELFVSMDAQSKDIKGWTVTRGQIDWIGPFWEHQEGKRSVDLHGSPGYGGILQTISTVKDVKYRLTFYLTSTPGCAKPKKAMAVEIDKVATKFECDSTGKNKPDWKKQTLTFTAKGAETTIEFYTLEKDDANCGPAIDDVSVVRVR